MNHHNVSSQSVTKERGCLHALSCHSTIKGGAGIAQYVQRFATGWTVWGSNPCGGRDFPHPSSPTLGPTQPPIKWLPGLSWGIKWPGVVLTTHPPSSAEVKERAELYLWAFVACYTVTFTFTFTITIKESSADLPVRGYYALSTK